MKRQKQLLAFFGHHKCATTWISSIIGDVCRELKLRQVTVYGAKTFNYNLVRFVQENSLEFLSYNNANYEYVRQLENVRGFHVIRDPRDIIVSAYYSHLYSHSTSRWPELIEHRKTLEGLSKEDGLLLEMEFNEQHLNDMYHWNYGLPNILELRMEELIRSPYEYIVGVIRFLGLLDEDHYSGKKRIFHILCKVMRRVEWMSRRNVSFPIALRSLPVERMLGIVWENDFAKNSGGRVRGQEDTGSHYRKGIPGDWRNHFNKDHIEVFKERYNHIVIGLGYEQDANWV